MLCVLALESWARESRAACHNSDAVRLLSICVDDSTVISNIFFNAVRNIGKLEIL